MSTVIENNRTTAQPVKTKAEKARAVHTVVPGLGFSGNDLSVGQQAVNRLVAGWRDPAHQQQADALAQHLQAEACPADANWALSLGKLKRIVVRSRAQLSRELVEDAEPVLKRIAANFDQAETAVAGVLLRAQAREAAGIAPATLVAESTEGKPASPAAERARAASLIGRPDLNLKVRGRARAGWKQSPYGQAQTAEVG